MQQVADFRTLQFSLLNVRNSGEYIGRGSYRKLYVIENTIRVMIHSVLSAQLGTTQWWVLTVDQPTMDKIQRVKNNYKLGPGPSLPGKHDIYYLFLPDLTEIINNNAHLIRPIIPDIDQWRINLDRIHFPRNIVGHMNWLHKIDENEIHKTYKNINSIIKYMRVSSISILIP